MGTCILPTTAMLKYSNNNDVTVCVCGVQWMADHVDLILVFFDPIGKHDCLPQKLTKSLTAWIVEQLAWASKHPCRSPVGRCAA